MLAITDVCYDGSSARAACVVAADWRSPSPRGTYVETMQDVAPYKPGSFYRRELPCLTQVLRALPSVPAIVVVDGYVWLPPSKRPGLGAHLHQALGGSTAVVGIAKRPFGGAQTAPFVVPVLRGRSTRPLFVTAAGIEHERAAACVRAMWGADRLPVLVRWADALARGLPPPR